MRAWQSAIVVDAVLPDSERDVHLVPYGPAEREHESTMACWCAPLRDREEALVVVHNRRAQA